MHFRCAPTRAHLSAPTYAQEKISTRSKSGCPLCKWTISMIGMNRSSWHLIVLVRVCNYPKDIKYLLYFISNFIAICLKFLFSFGKRTYTFFVYTKKVVINCYLPLYFTTMRDNKINENYQLKIQWKRCFLKPPPEFWLVYLQSKKKNPSFLGAL